MSKIFTSQSDELLIEEVSKYPQLYDHGHKDFKNMEIRENIWNRVSAILKKDSEVCKGRWKNIRDNYLKHRRKKLGTGSSAIVRPPKWHLYKFLTFLDLVRHERPSTSNMENNTDIGNEEDSDTMESLISDHDLPLEDTSLRSPAQNEFSDTEPASKILRTTPDSAMSRSTTPNSGKNSMNKNKVLENIDKRSQQRLQLLENIVNQKEKEDDVDLFMRSIAMTIKKMPAHQIAHAKLSILQVVSDLERSSNTEKTSDDKNTYTYISL